MSDSSDSGPISKESPAAEISQRQLLATTWALFGVATLFVGARALVRLHAFSRFFVDDALVFAAWLLLMANGIVVTLMTPAMYNLLEVSTGHIKPQPDFLAQSSYYLKMQLASTILFWSCVWTIKASFLAFFWRLTDSLKYYRWAWWAITIFTGLAYCGCIITYPVSCHSFTLGECETPYNFRLELISINYSTAVDCLSDFFIMALPCALALRAKLPLRQRLALASVFGLALVVISFTIIRVVASAAGDPRPEISWLALWSSIQSSVSMYIACIVSFRVLFVSTRRTTASSGYTGSGGRLRPRSSVKTRSGSLFKSPFPSPALVENFETKYGTGTSQGHELHETSHEPVALRSHSGNSESMRDFLLDMEMPPASSKTPIKR